MLLSVLQERIELIGKIMKKIQILNKLLIISFNRKWERNEYLKFARTMHDIYGVVYDNDQKFVVAPESKQDDEDDDDDDEDDEEDD